MIVLFILSLALPAFGDEFSGRVVGGSNANIANHPWQASLRNSGIHSCGAVMISGTRAVTAAHCGGGAISTYSVMAGSSERTVTSCATCAYRNPTAFVRHPDFANNPSAGYPSDIAVLWFANIATNANIAYIGLAEASDGDFTGSTGWVTGWGRLSSAGGSATTLQEGRMNVISNDDCVAVWGANRIRAEHICLLSDTVSMCGGDNGGPFVVEGASTLLVGVSSWGEANCNPIYPSVFVRVSFFRDWIVGQ